MEVYEAGHCTGINTEIHSIATGLEYYSSDYCDKIAYWPQQSCQTLLNNVLFSLIKLIKVCLILAWFQSKKIKIQPNIQWHVIDTA